MLVKIEAQILIFPGTDFHFPSTSVPPGTFFRLCRPFHTFAPATGKARPPIVERRQVGTSSCSVEADLSLRHVDLLRELSFFGDYWYVLWLNWRTFRLWIMLKQLLNWNNWLLLILALNNTVVTCHCRVTVSVSAKKCDCNYSARITLLSFKI